MRLRRSFVPHSLNGHDLNHGVILVQEAEHSRWLWLSYWLPAARFMPSIWTGELWREFQTSTMEWRFARSLGIYRAPASVSHRSTEFSWQIRCTSFKSSFPF